MLYLSDGGIESEVLRDMTQEKLRIGIIGAGGFAAQHMEAFAEIPEIEVVAFMRRSEGPLRKMQEQWGVPKGYTDHREMLNDPDIDAIDIITPTDSHKAYALDAIASGRPVLCEKPLALNAADCEEMLNAAENAGVIHAVNFNQRGRTPVGRMKRYIDAGYVGDVYHVNIRWGMSMQQDARPDVGSWRFLPEHGGGTVYELIHVFDMCRFLNGEIARVSAVLNTAEKHRQFIDAPDGFDVEVPDSSAFLLEYVNGAYAVIHTSFVQRGEERGRGVTVDVAGSSGRIISDGINGILGSSGENAPVAEIDPGPSYPQPYERFVSAALAGDQPLIDTGFEAGVEAARIVDAIHKSWAERRWVDVER